MVPILYDSIVEGTVPSDFGLGALTDTISSTTNEGKNSIYELTLVYAAQGIHAEDIEVGRYIKAKPNYTDAPQLFKIYKVGKVLNGRFEINCEHVSYELSKKAITSGDANNCASACALLSAQAGAFTINTDKSVSGDFVITEPSSVKSWFGGKKGSLLDVYGGGEWYYNNFTATLKANRGVTTPRTTIRYGKNLTELNQTIDCSNLYTHVLSFYKSEGMKVTGSEVATGLSGTKRVLVLDASGEFDGVPTSGDLDSFSTAYIGSHNLTTPKTNFTLNFVQSGQLFDRVDLCDNVNVYFEKYGINATVKCIRVKWDVLRERYIETEFGDPKQSIADTISENSSAIATASAEASEAVNIANGKARVFITTPEPPYDVGDIWTDSNDIYYCTTPRAETITGSGSGSIVSFNTLIGGSLTGCSVDIEGSQDLHGYTKPWAGGCGKNKLNYEAWKNVPIMRGTAVFENNGITLTATANDCYTHFTIANGFPVSCKVYANPGEPVTISWEETTNKSGLVYAFADGDAGVGVAFVNNNTVKKLTYSLPSGASFITFRFGVSNSGDTISYKNIQIEKNGSATSWEPYENICPLTAYTEANVAISGHNLWDEEWELGWLSSSDGTPTASNTAIRSTNFCRIQPEQTYYFGINDPDATQYYCAVYLYDKTQTFTRRVWCTNMTFSTNAGEYYFKLSTNTNGIYGTTYKDDMSVNYPSSVTSYSAYEGEVFNISFDTAGTVYKGNLNVLTGELSVTHKVVDLGDLAWSQAGTADAGKKRFRGTLDPEGKACPNNQKADLTCEQYATITANDTYSLVDGISGSDVDKYIFVYDNTKDTMTAPDFKTAMSGIKLAYELATPATFNLTPQEIVSAIGNNVIFADTGDISIAYYVDGFTMNDWSLATDYISESRLEDAIANASDIITGTAGGYVVWHDSNGDGEPDEILIMNTASIDTATKVWRWNAGGLGYSGTGYDGTYSTAITNDGQIVADAITTGNLDASLVTIQHLKATMFEGGKLVLGGAANVEGVFQLKNENDIVIGEMNKDGLKFYGAGPEGARPYVLINNTVGFQGCDANDNPIFWVNQDEFSMKKCVAENEISACKKIRFIPVTIKDLADQVINDGVAVVAIVQT